MTVTTRLLGLTMLILLVTATGPAHPANHLRPPEERPHKPDWQDLMFKHTGLLGSVTTRLTLQPAVPPDPVQQSVPPTEQARNDQPPMVPLRLQVRSSIVPAAGAPLEIESSLWFVPGERLPSLLLRIRSGKNPYEKQYIFAHEGVYRMETAAPETPQDEHSPDTVAFYPFPEWVQDCDLILESSQIIPHLVTHVLQKTSMPQHLCVFDRKQVYRLTPRVHGNESVDARYRQRADSQSELVQSATEAIHLSLTSQTEETGKHQAKPFTLLGLKEELHIWISSSRGIPLRVQGRVQGERVVVLELKEILQ